MMAPRKWMLQAMWFPAGLVIALPIAWDRTALAGTIDTIRSAQAVRIAYRDDARPFSYNDANSTEPAGFMVDLCRAVVKKLSDQLGLPGLKITYVSVTAANRFDAIVKHDADLLCEPTSATLARRKIVDFSIPTFVDGAGLMTNDVTLDSLQSLAGHKVGVLSGTTTEDVLRKLLKDHGVSAEVVPAKTHNDGVTALESGETSAYFGDRAILFFLRKDVTKDPEKLHVAKDYLTIEPYALALSRGDEDFRLAVDTALSRIFRSDEIGEIYDHGFGGKAKQSDLIEALFAISGLPD